MGVEELRPALVKLYGDADGPLARYADVDATYRRHFGGGGAVEYFSSPGRSEISGNHTDHNGGKVIGAAISLDAIAAAAPTDDAKITLVSHGYDAPIVVDLNRLEAADENTAAEGKKLARSANLLRGLAAGFVERGMKIGGFRAASASNVAEGSGLSSSAAIEMLVGTILSHFYNAGRVDVPTLAQVGRYAENAFWHKGSGLLDQMSCGTGGMVYMDFADRQNPRVHKIDFDFNKAGYALLVVNTGGDHADLTPLYSSIPAEMEAVAKALRKSVLAETSLGELLPRVGELRKAVGDRAILRAIHFFTENDRVDEQRRRLEAGDFASFLALVTESGSSSWRLLQNVYDPHELKKQEIPLALALAEQFLRQHPASPGAYRVHGGGFGGTVLVMLRRDEVPAFLEMIRPVFGENSATVLGIRNYGAVRVGSLL